MERRLDPHWKQLARCGLQDVNIMHNRPARVAGQTTYAISKTCIKPPATR
jgi:hypothetical protein